MTSNPITTDTDKAKKAAGQAAAALVEDRMCLGLGTGSTTAFALEAIGRRIQREQLSVQGVPTSFAAAQLARRHGIPLTSLEEHSSLDLAIDGADAVDPNLNLIKGRGGAHTGEKIVAAQADRFVVVADPSKTVARLGGTVPLPVEVVPMGVGPISRRLENLGAVPQLRAAEAKDGPVVTDQGLWIIDASFEQIDEPHALGRAIKELPGVLDHGLFLDMAELALVGQPDGSVRRLEK